MISRLGKKERATEIAKRSKTILDEYKGEYDSTMIILSLLGLIVIPRENEFNSIPDNAVDACLIRRLKNSINQNEKNGNPYSDESLNYILKNLRNAICHGHIDFYGEQSNYTEKPFIIREIEFMNHHSNTEFTITLRLEDIRDLVSQLVIYYEESK